MIQEGVIQASSGLHPLKATLFRLTASCLTVICVAPFLGLEGSADLHAIFTASDAAPFSTMLQDWLWTTLRVSAKVLVIVMVILTLLEVMKVLDWMNPIVRALTPILTFLGLSPRVGVLWMTAVVFGLAYGAAVIVEEAQREDLTPRELEELQLSIGINHSMIEDPTLFMAMGLNPLWLWIPRLIMAIAAVHLLRLWRRLQAHREAAGA